METTRFQASTLIQMLVFVSHSTTRELAEMQIGSNRRANVWLLVLWILARKSLLMELKSAPSRSTEQCKSAHTTRRSRITVQADTTVRCTKILAVLKKFLTSARCQRLKESNCIHTPSSVASITSIKQLESAMPSFTMEHTETRTDS